MDSVPWPGPAHLARSSVRISPQPAPHGQPIPSPTNIRFPQEEGRSDWAQVGPFSGKPPWACCLSPRPAPVFLLMASTSPGGPEAGTWHILAPEAPQDKLPGVGQWASLRHWRITLLALPWTRSWPLTKTMKGPWGEWTEPPTAASTHLPPTLMQFLRVTVVLATPECSLRDSWIPREMQQWETFILWGHYVLGSLVMQ